MILISFRFFMKIYLDIRKINICDKTLSQIILYDQ